MTADPLPFELADAVPAGEMSSSSRPPVSLQEAGGAYGEVYARFLSWLSERRLAPATKRGLCGAGG